MKINIILFAKTNQYRSQNAETCPRNSVIGVLYLGDSISGQM